MKTPLWDRCNFIVLISLLCTWSSEARDFYSYSVTDANGRKISLELYRGKVSLVVNVASECGYTDSHYRELVELQEKFSPSEFNVLAFPCNQFGKQEPKTVDQIVQFAKTEYHANFPIFAKINVKDDDTGYADPAFSNLIWQLGQPVTWNFWKFLVNQNGKLLVAWPPTTSPLKLLPDINRAMEEMRSAGNDPSKFVQKSTDGLESPQPPDTALPDGYNSPEGQRPSVQQPSPVGTGGDEL